MPGRGCATCRPNIARLFLIIFDVTIKLQAVLRAASLPAMESSRISAPIADRPQSLALPFEPLPQFRQNALEETAARADNRGKRIGIFIVAYNAITTLSKVLKRITPEVWRNVEQVVVFDDASQDATYELAVGIQAMANLPKLRVLKHAKNLGYGGNQKAGYRYFIEQGFDVVVLLHGDGQYAPELLSHMYGPLVRGKRMRSSARG